MRWNFLPVIILAMSCNNAPSDQMTDERHENNSIVKDIEPTSQDLIDSIVTYFNVDNFLTKTPLNSGVSSGDNFIFEPDTLGYFYHFYKPEPNNIIVNEKGDPVNETEPMWFNMTIFKFGNNTTNFDKQEHLLIELESFNSDENLGTLNLVGSNIRPFLNSYRSSGFENDTVRILINKYSLRLAVKDSLIEAFKLVRIN